jgi:hypothetical protein
MTTREALRRLVDELPDLELEPARRYLEYLRNVGSDPMLRTLMEAPLDDEPLTADDEAAIAEGQAEIDRGEVVNLDEVKRQLGCELADRSERPRPARFS